MNAPADLDSSSTFLKVLQILLDQDCELLSIQDMGRLSTCSHGLNTFVDSWSIWKKIFQNAANAGRAYHYRYSNGKHNHRYQTWHGENKLLGCFSDPSEMVLDKVGYKRAATCLMAGSCTRCGRMSGSANPLTMERLCSPCYKNDQSNYVISKSKAKEAFLLSEKDIKQLKMKAEFPDRTFAGKECVSTILLMSEVKRAAYEKYGGTTGLAQEIRKRKRAAEERFQKSQKPGAEPMKKRSKIEKLDDRPADNLARFELTSCLGLPIGTFYDIGKMEPSRLCNKCGLSGAIHDICMHEKLEHGFVTNFLQQTDSLPAQCPQFQGLTPLEKMPGATMALIQMFSNASVEYLRVEEDLEVRKVALYEFKDSGVKVCVDYHCVNDWSTSLYDGNVQLCFQTTLGQVPLQLVNLSWGNFGIFHEHLDVVKLPHINSLVKALGQPGIDPIQLMALFVSRVLTSKESKSIVSQIGEDSESESENPFARGVWDILASD